MSNALALIDALLADERTASHGMVALLVAQGEGMATSREVHARLPFAHLHVDCECPE